MLSGHANRRYFVNRKDAPLSVEAKTFIWDPPPAGIVQREGIAAKQSVHAAHDVCYAYACTHSTLVVSTCLKAMTATVHNYDREISWTTSAPVLIFAVSHHDICVRLAPLSQNTFKLSGKKLPYWAPGLEWKNKPRPAQAADIVFWFSSVTYLCEICQPFGRKPTTTHIVTKCDKTCHKKWQKKTQKHIQKNKRNQQKTETSERVVTHALDVAMHHGAHARTSVKVLQGDRQLQRSI